MRIYNDLWYGLFRKLLWQQKETIKQTKDFIVEHNETIKNMIISNPKAKNDIQLRALSNSFSKLKIVILVYRKNSSAFLDMMGKVSQNKLPILYIDDFDFNSILELEKVVEEGGHIGIMGGRVALSNDKKYYFGFFR